MVGLGLVALAFVFASSSAAWLDFMALGTPSSTPTPVAELDILKALNLSDDMRGVSEVKGGALSNIPSWRFHTAFDNVQLPPSAVATLLSAWSNSTDNVTATNQVSLYFVIRQHKRTVATLVSLNSPGKMSPWLRLTSNLKGGGSQHQLILFYHVVPRDDKLHQVAFDLPRLQNWTHLLVTASGKTATLFLDCEPPQEKSLVANIDLHFPKDSLIYFRQEPGFKKKFLGTVQVAKIMPYALTDRPWNCTDSLHRSEEQLMNEENEWMEDKNDENNISDLEWEIKKLQNAVNELQKQNIKQNEKLKKITKFCGCQVCFDEDDEIYPEGHTWNIDSCTVCKCEKGEIICAEIPKCSDPCISHPCLNNGECVKDAGTLNFTCICLPGFAGSCCEISLNVVEQNFPAIVVESRQDFCSPNPCLNGGTCKPSVWPSRPDWISCHCNPDFEGLFCEHDLSLSKCFLHMERGSCSDEIRRWYFNVETMECEEFFYSGCYGNANNFASYYDCRVTCMIGACCYRYPKYSTRLIGYNVEGLDRYGFDKNGSSKDRSYQQSFGGAVGLYDENGYNFQGFDENGYNRHGINRKGYDHRGFHHVTGYNHAGFDVFGDHDGIIDYNADGWDSEGFDRSGFNCKGYNRNGWDTDGLCAGYNFECRALTLSNCQDIGLEFPYLRYEVVSFNLGKRCEKVNCEEGCGCVHDGKTYEFGEEFSYGCNLCHCQENGRITCKCNKIFQRKEIRDLSKQEMRRYQDSIKYLYENTNFPSRWHSFASLYRDHLPQAAGTVQFLPWMRYFIRLIEMELQQFDCDVTIPYLDWTMDVGDLKNSFIWSNLYFGGSGNKDTFCVEMHPFQNFHPHIWNPCLRRNFNSSVFLPDSIHIALLLEENSFEKFSAQLEAFALLFHLFIGGHMATPEAPYDPIFLSHYAFIDKLWDTWQNKQITSQTPFNYIFPSDHRYVPMIPFDVVPDDILLIESQLCIKYIPSGEGVSCFSEEDHGNRGDSVDMNAYDVFHYNEKGFDSSGWDKDGFGVDGFNIDGFDHHGYDRSGYNRFGFNHYGCSATGFCINGTWITGHESSTFNKYGFNKYGFNKFGLDRDGFDAYGYDVSGFDRNGCNSTSRWPITVGMKVWVDQHLTTMGKPALVNIVRTCPAVTKIPVWMLQLHWMIRTEQMNIIDEMDHKWEVHHPTLEHFPKVDYVNSTEWLPSTPDDRFCFFLNRYSKCLLGSIPTKCFVDMCANASCPSFPNALCWTRECNGCQPEFYDGVTGEKVFCKECIDEQGQTHKEGSSWQDSPCRNCTCKKGQISCLTEECNDPKCQNPVILPHHCCPLCDDCEFRGQIINNGIIFNPNPCTTCECKDGDVICAKASCQVPLNCSGGLITVPGECCPICSHCGDKKHGTSWREEGTCQTCTCEQGKVTCEKIHCQASLTCTHPWTPPGKCCPICKDCEYEGHFLRNGENIELDPCNTCICRVGSVVCLKASCPPTLCSFPVMKSGQCCPTCPDNCEYEERNYQNGDTFTPDFNPCLNCSCQNGIVRCAPKICPEVALPCSRPVKLPGQCCPTECATCSDNGKQYKHNEEWTPTHDSCLKCICLDGIVSCNTVYMCPFECEHGIRLPGDCCSQCKDCHFDGQVISNGITFARHGDQCHQCHCRNGTVRCSKKQLCPNLPCKEVETPVDSCCPICKGCIDERGHSYPYGDRWINPKDECQACICIEGKIVCERKKCETYCKHPVKRLNSCCPVCDGCQFDGILYPNRAVVKSKDPCDHCICYSGNVECESHHCPPIQCSRPIKVAGQCCPQCDECSFNNQIYVQGQNFISPLNPCLNCSCKNGQIDCVQINHLCNPQCSHPSRVLGECCPVCNDCEYERRTYRNNEDFRPLEYDPCFSCKCQNGDVMCQTLTCPTVPCKSPITFPGSCCPECPPLCYVDGIEKHEGEKWQNLEDECSECTCIQSHVRCYSKPCPAVSCVHPSATFGQCCPTCNHCEFTGRLYHNGQKFIHSEDVCQQCICNNGSVTCTTIMCPPLQCRNQQNLKHQCCPLCSINTDCSFFGKEYKNRQTFIHPHNPCEECTCLDGEVICQTALCPPTDCSNPMEGQCCKSCSGCSYGGKNYPNNQYFSDPQQPCRECSCINGDVMCHPRECPQLDQSCKKPVKAPGECCAVCRDCLFGNHLFSEGEIFMDPEDPCRECRCLYPDVVCRLQTCPEAACNFPVDGQCCKECSDCKFEGIRFRNGYDFSHPYDPCSKCKCQYGNVTCSPMKCSPTKCSHPIPGPCCDECHGPCLFKGRHYNDGEEILDSSNPCMKCVCLKGSVECEKHLCPPVNCLHPVSKGCCLSCSDCLHNGNVFMNGEEFTDVTNKCVKCTCKSGNVTCRTQQCPEVNCLNPVVRDCCPECPETCYFKGSEYKNGETILNPHNPCQQCICQEGSILCSFTECQKCSHPVPKSLNQCCPDCSNCFYKGEQYENSQTFINDCEKCVCKDGSVTCHNIVCPKLTCPLRTKPPGQCCEICKGCIYENRVYDSGVSWVSTINPCMSCQCVGGVVTCAEVRCIVPCSNPIPVPGQCCPVCPNCVIDGQTYEHGVTFAPNDNPCEECICEHGQLHCFHHQCPSLIDCPKESIIPPSNGDCCPTCGGFSSSCTLEHYGMKIRPTDDPCFMCECKDFNWLCIKDECPPIECPDHRIIHNPKECCPKCEVCIAESHDTIYETGDIWKDPLDPCIKCECEFGFITCNEEECDSVVCESGETLYHPDDECCAVCVTPSNVSCTHENKTFLNGETWKISECTTCTCDFGKPKCQTKRCMSVICQSDEILSVDPGKCCPKCVPRPAICVAFGDPHYRTFDGALLHFQGTCRYLLTSDCQSDDFSVEVENSNRGFVGVSWTQSVTVKLSGTIVDLLQEGRVVVNGINVTLPYLYEPYVYIEKSSESVLLNTNLGLKVVWNGDSYLEVSVPRNYKGQTCGLCGNFNDFPQDDMRLRSGQVVKSEAAFGNGWKILDNKNLNCDAAEDIDPCQKGGYRARKLANAKCSVLKGPLFSPCHTLIPAEPYYAACVYDLCACAENDDCLCDILSTYALICAKAGVALKWRSAGLCAIGCPSERGLIFDECGPPCPRTCKNKDISPRELAYQCFKPCVPGCQCPAEKVLHKGSCINPSSCPSEVESELN